MLNIIYQLIRTARPRQWLKNFAVFAPITFAGLLLEPKNFELAVRAFLVFCALSSATYFMNDIVDADKDKLHPIKRNRPIPSGKLSEKLAVMTSILLATVGLIYAYKQVGSYFTAICMLYLVMQVCYSFYFRHVIILDSLIVAAGFIIRVFAGGVASYSSVSSWLLLTTIGLSLLLAFGKRRSEKTILVQHQTSQSQPETRATLRHYPDSLLDSMISTSASFCLITYALFTFQTSPHEVTSDFVKYLPSILGNPKWLMVTIPVVIYGVARYLYVMYEKGDAESPERVLLSDKPLLVTVLLWTITILFILYGLPRFTTLF
ncbi:decaprenyl-phosphate phosphoribosyltransferase [candidate division WWE3 bacterium CG08_land_8_20_14_0_20_41_10]|uniref:Decaprenyl-phosphate phosphoribosyltransferase n=1 Tax=candidate division WWE3 bacterium CG08_land_8_20_14_0_20_41_10 TaxID=1975085 RepID=A0A2H0XBI0_UNCKA|nr:MAG: decaprenyl-phosphate phosphoribosyltransferase [candidate division WWE3 bacterium CG08_land_8_20_14_0_20_41_10]